MNFKKQLTYKKEVYTKSETVIANYFLKGNKSVTSKQLAEDLHISPATISRFVKKIGYANYDVFIDAYNYEQELASGSENVTEIYQTHLDMLIENYKLLDEDSINKLISMFGKNKIVIAAIENTSLPCIDFAKRLGRFGIDVRVAKTQEEIVIESTLLEKGDVFIVVSISGINKNYEKVLHRLKRKNVYCYGISTNAKNIIGLCDDYSLINLDNSSLLSQNYSYLYPLVIIFDNIYIRFEKETTEKQRANKSKIIDEILEA